MFKSKLAKQVAKELIKHNIKMKGRWLGWDCGNCYKSAYSFCELQFYKSPLGDTYTEWRATDFLFCDRCCAMTYQTTHKGKCVAYLSNWWKNFVCPELPIELAKQERIKLHNKIDELSKYILEMEQFNTAHIQAHQEKQINNTLTTSAYR